MNSSFAVDDGDRSRLAAGVAGGAVALAVDLEQQDVLVAIDEDADDGKVSPEVSPFFHRGLRDRLQKCTCPVTCVRSQGFVVHVGEHQHGVVAGIRDDGPDQSVLIEPRVKRRRFLEVRLSSEREAAGRRAHQFHEPGLQAGFDLNSPVNCVVMVATLRLLTPRIDMQV